MHSYIMQHVERASVDHFSTQHLLLRHRLVQIASGSFMLQILFCVHGYEQFGVYQTFLLHPSL